MFNQAHEAGHVFYMFATYELIISFRHVIFISAA